MTNCDGNIVSRNIMQTYGGVQTGYGIVMDTVTNTQVVDYQINGYSDAIYGFMPSNANHYFQPQRSD